MITNNYLNNPKDAAQHFSSMLDEGLTIEEASEATNCLFRNVGIDRVVELCELIEGVL